MTISSETEEHFFSFCHSMNSLYTCAYRCRDLVGNNLLPMILSASALNSCMIEFSIPDFNEKMIKNVISLILNFSNTERREVVFRTKWFIGQYYSERGERLPLSLYISRTRRERTFVAVLHFQFTTLFVTASYDCILQTPDKSTRFLTFPKNHRCECKVLLLLLLLLHSMLHFIIFSMPNRSQKPPFSMSMSGKNYYKIVSFNFDMYKNMIKLLL